ncbi:MULTISPECIES: hypothetical protein [Vagococcus]|uniref:Uncharacterized protein n=1 Tax=Vagococcus fluvialis bH819 TaxID=1255619 RepID=A0A1X6WML2_9ENTE|nr:MULTISPECIES: hypothetical protein [Vagococcus]SLM85581.1 hypothetical protein FM121_05735 [Vagococcus fluvialis bH819]HCM89550.1 hypothetical protein [Vagococcus sp.]
MKRLIMKQGETSIHELVTIVNQKGKDEYNLSMSSVKKTPRITITHVSKTSEATVNEIRLETVERFVIEVDRKVIFIIEKEKNSKDYIVKSDKMFIEGDLNKMSFDIMLGYRKVAKVRERWISIGESYELTVFEHENEVALVALLATLDFVKYNTNEHS